MKRLILIWDEIKSSFWFLPIFIVFLGVGAAIGLVYLDDGIRYRPQGVLRYVFAGSLESARSVLSTISSAMIGVAGTVFSITLVALTLASSQFGPRLLRNFMTQRLNQIVLGAYVATYAYCLIVLNSVTETQAAAFVPVISVFAAILATIANILLLILFIHHIAVSIQADHIISEVSKTLDLTLRRLYPEDMGKAPPSPDPDWREALRRFSHHGEMRCPKSGYIQDVDERLLFETMRESGCVLVLNKRPGSFLVQGEAMGRIYGLAPLSREFVAGLERAVFIGDFRTPLQDAEFSVQQIVEVASRALSPGVNDPFTATACIDNLSAAMCYLAKAAFPSPVRYDDSGHLRIVTDALTFAGLMDAAFNPIRQFSTGNPVASIRLMEALAAIHGFAASDDHRAVVRKHADKVMRAGIRTLAEPNDLRDMKERYSAIGGADMPAPGG